MIVELVGAPGSGKTTLLPAVVESLREQGLQTYTALDAARPLVARTWLGRAISWLAPAAMRGPLLWQAFLLYSRIYWLRFVAERGGLVRQVLATQRGRPKEADLRERRVLAWFRRMAGDRQFLAARAGALEAVVFDEGFVHRVVQLFASSAELPSPELIAAYLDAVPVPDLLVAVTAPSHVCWQRIQQRGLWKHLRHRSDAEVSQFVAHAHAAVGLAVEHATSRAWRVVVVDNGGDDPAVARRALRRKPLDGSPEPRPAPEAMVG